jgi:energy-coupling factor transporter ATP-binding protein EcfA2
MLGANGTGKTTSISLMLGLRRPTEEQMRLFGLPPTDRRARSRAGVRLQESGTTGVRWLLDFRANPNRGDHATPRRPMKTKITRPSPSSVRVVGSGTVAANPCAHIACTRDVG